MIKFNSFIEKALLKNPLNGFKEEEQTLEFRQDPLLGTWARINIDRAKRTHQARRGDAGYLKAVIEKTTAGCYFCPNAVNKKTPEFPESLGVGARIKSGTCTIFPNLFPFSKYHAVGTLSKGHGKALGKISPKEWECAISGAREYLAAVYRTDPKAKFGAINMNYMPPAAASIIHPHIQITCDARPSVMQGALIEKSAEYFRKNKAPYFGDLARAEIKGNGRLIKKGKAIVWIASYAPFAANDVTGIFNSKRSILELSKKDISELAGGLSRIFAGYEKIGAESANFTLFSAPFGEKSDSGFRLHARIVSRPNFRDGYASDRGFMEVLHREPVISALPEEVARDIKPEF